MGDSDQLEINMCKFTWKIKDFSKRNQQTSSKMLSPIFKVQGCSAFYWRIFLYPFGVDQDSEGFVSLFLHHLSQENVQVYFEIVLSNVTGVEIAKKNTTHKFCSEMQNRTFGWFKFYKRDDLLEETNNLLVDDTLNITCAIHINVCNEHEVTVKDRILDNYESLFLNGTFSDVTITIKRKKIHAHKSILSARSKVFAAMFDHDMEENNTNILKIDDIGYDIMNELLLFLYSGKVEDLQKNAKLLLPVADKYEILELKAICEESLWKNVAIEDASEIVSIADLYNCTALKTRIIDYIIKNIKEIIKTPRFKKLTKSNPELYETIMTQVVEKRLMFYQLSHITSLS